MNAELIKALRYCVVHPYRPCDGCVLFETDGCINVLHGAAADALEAAEKRIAELEAQMPKQGEWIVDKNGYPQIICSICDVHIPMVAGWCMDAHINYCPNCGAKMETVTDCHASGEGEQHGES